MATEQRLINANAFHLFLEVIRQEYLDENTFSSDFAAKVIETVQDEYLAKFPTIEARPVVHGRWELYPSSMHRRCSVCKMEYDRPKFNVRANYCPNCGADMKSKGD